MRQIIVKTISNLYVVDNILDSQMLHDEMLLTDCFLYNKSTNKGDGIWNNNEKCGEIGDINNFDANGWNEGSILSLIEADQQPLIRKTTCIE